MELEIPVGISKQIMINLKEKAEVEIMTNPRQSAIDVINLVITHLNVILGCLMKKKRKRSPITWRTRKVRPC